MWSTRVGLGLAAGTATIMGTVLTVGIAPYASAAPSQANGEQVLHFFLSSESMEFLTARGKPFVPSQADPPSPGDEQERTDLDYAGDQLWHARDYTATDHQLCVFNSQDNLVCQAQFAIGGSMVLAQVTLTNPSTTLRETVYGGTGVFQGDTGTVVFVSPSVAATSGDLTITLHQP
jgi:hypothetical protein